MTLFGCATLTLLTFSAINGHLYQVHGLRWLAGWGVQGLLALQFLLCASLPQLLLRYAGTRRAHPTTARAIDIACIVSRKSTRLNPVTNAHLVCRLPLEQQNISNT